MAESQMFSSTTQQTQNVPTHKTKQKKVVHIKTFASLHATEMTRWGIVLKIRLRQAQQHNECSDFPILAHYL